MRVLVLVRKFAQRVTVVSIENTAGKFITLLLRIKILLIFKGSMILILNNLNKPPENSILSMSLKVLSHPGLRVWVFKVEGLT